MRMAWLLAGGLAAAAAHPAAAPAQAQLGDPAPTRIVTTRGLPATISGGLAVTFRGDPAAGCAAAGLCGVEGTVTWTPGGRAGVIAVEYVQRGRRRIGGAVTFAREPVTASDVVRRTTAGGLERCTDAYEAGRGIVLDEARPAGGLAVALPAPPLPLTGDVLRTRCPGPHLADVRHALPVAALGRAVLRRGRTTLDLAGEGTFAAGGLAGNVRSTLVLRLGRSGLEREDSRPPRRHRLLTATYAIERLTGNVTTTFSGHPDPALCGPLDACGASGTVTATPGVPPGQTLTLTASAPARRPWRDLRAALGLSRRGRRAGVSVDGFALWVAGPGTVTAAVERPGGAPPCRDTSPLPGGTLQLRRRGGSLAVAYGVEPEPLLNRCPGPGRLDLAPGEALATSRLPLRAVDRRRMTVRLARTIDFASDGYAGKTRADLGVGLRRLYVRRSTVLADP